VDVGAAVVMVECKLLLYFDGGVEEGGKVLLLRARLSDAPRIRLGINWRG
jgi:hypothetical protein